MDCVVIDFPQLIVRTPRKKKPKFDEPIPRNCLACETPFIGEGRFNRICRPCKNSAVFEGLDQ